MGNIAAIDTGIVVLRCAIFDRKNDLYPYKLLKRKQSEGKKNYFMVDYSFYSKEHGGTFHFMQFNIMKTQEFMQSLEFDILLDFLDKQYKIQRDAAAKFVENLELTKNIIDYRESEEFAEWAIRRDF